MEDDVDRACQVQRCSWNARVVATHDFGGGRRILPTDALAFHAAGSDLCMKKRMVMQRLCAQVEMNSLVGLCRIDFARKFFLDFRRRSTLDVLDAYVAFYGDESRRLATRTCATNSFPELNVNVVVGS